jgi:hypothetical protein
MESNDFNFIEKSMGSGGFIDIVVPKFTEEEDITIVCEQANLTRADAIAALKECEGDVVDAIIKYFN